MITSDLTDVAIQVQSLNNRRAWQAICTWLAKHGPRDFNERTKIARAIWAERKRLRAAVHRGAVVRRVQFARQQVDAEPR